MQRPTQMRDRFQECGVANVEEPGRLQSLLNRHDSTLMRILPMPATCAPILHCPDVVGSPIEAIVPAVDIHYRRRRQLFRIDAVKRGDRNGDHDAA